MASGAAPGSTATIECPVCRRGGLPSSVAACPSCRTDLAPLHKLAALAHLIGSEAPSSVVPTRPRALWLIAGLALGLAGGWLGASVWPARAPSAGVAPPPPMTQHARPPGAQHLDELEARLASLDGVAVRREPGALVVSPQEPLFARGSAEPLPSATAFARGLAETLSGGTDPLRIELEGHTDAAAVSPKGRWPDNWSLGLSRAHVLAEQMRAVWGEPRLLQDLKLDISSAGALPASGPAGPAPRRTVLVRVTMEAVPNAP
jgi:outer membrane protein OmpA-like peptidoglycan-associated protein